ncbi:hypothetical protein [Pseudarthrobacter phenanthrenivorans]|uniref:hypothetical protein n=1 Tax=Pseudarthrobacter phenanthrenivorans TaxID=361575 RepID=UPI002F359BE9
MAIDLNEDGTWTPTRHGAAPSTEGFRKASWGASHSEVKASESSEPQLEQDEYLDFEVRLGRFKCLAAYIFVGDQLVRGKYLVTEQYQNQTQYLTVYEELKGSLSKKYGSPYKDETYWLNDLYKDDYSEWGMAVGCGHLSKFSFWETSDSTINIGLFGENFDVQVSVEYAGKIFDGVEDALKEARLLDDL